MLEIKDSHMTSSFGKKRCFIFTENKLSIYLMRMKSYDHALTLSNIGFSAMFIFFVVKNLERFRTAKFWQHFKRVIMINIPFFIPSYCSPLNFSFSPFSDGHSISIPFPISGDKTFPEISCSTFFLSSQLRV